MQEQGSFPDHPCSAARPLPFAGNWSRPGKPHHGGDDDDGDADEEDHDDEEDADDKDDDDGDDNDYDEKDDKHIDFHVLGKKEYSYSSAVTAPIG